MHPQGRLVVIAGSLGGVRAIRTLLKAMSPAYPAAIVIVQHRASGDRDYLPDVLGFVSVLPVSAAVDGERMGDGHVYVAPSDRQLRFSKSGEFSISQFVTPSHPGCTADATLASAAEIYGKFLVAVILTGSGRDGSTGAQAVKDAGGYVIVQDEVTSQAFSMPGSVIAAGNADRVLPLAEIASALGQLAN
jgi:two-component system chemotaxis response regulator CheB